MRHIHETWVTKSCIPDAGADGSRSPETSRFQNDMWRDSLAEWTEIMEEGKLDVLHTYGS